MAGPAAATVVSTEGDRLRFSFPRSLTIRNKLLLFCVCIVVFTALSITGATALVASRNARHRAVAQLESVATLKEQEVDSWTGGLSLNLDIVLSGQDIERDLRTLTVAKPGTDAYDRSYRLVQRRFNWASKRMKLFEELFFMGPKGEVLVSTDTGHEHQQLGMNDYFAQGVKGQFIEEPSYSLSLGKMTVVASCPVTFRGASIGVLAGRANLDSLNNLMLGRAGLGQTGETYLVGTNHRLLTDLRRPGHAIPDTYVRTAGAEAVVDRTADGSATYIGYAQDRVIGVYHWIPRLKVGLLAEQGEGEALHATRVALMTAGGLVLVAAVVAILAAIGLIHSIVRPLDELGETAGRIAAGELDLSADERRRDEIGTLARSFNRMTGQLRSLVRNLERRSDHLRAINKAGRQISSILDVDDLLPQVAHSLLETFGFDVVRILLLDDDSSGRLISCTQYGEDETTVDDVGELAHLPAVSAVLRTGESVLERRSPGDGDDLGAQRPSEVAVPILVGRQLAGVLNVAGDHPRPPNEEDVLAATTLADQLAIAIENARLYQSANELAAARERQRLARDLHDAVSQTLFSVSLIAEVLPRVYERDPDQGRERLEELRQLTRGALAEMRMLLLELRPAALAETSLTDLLRQLSEAVVGRWRIPVDLRLEVATVIPSEVSVAMYRIAQEALNNVAKHSGSGQASVTLRDCREHGRDALEMIIRDDGCGFDPKAMRPGRLGLGIMAERAESIGARLGVESAQGKGTSIRVVWQAETTTPPEVR